MHSIFYVCRILVENMERFKKEVQNVTWHIPSKFQKEMATKSVVVSLCHTLDRLKSDFGVLQRFL